ncbi:GTPase IMAP family member 8-like isoform X2 [Pungitius pungitius]|uniref:GTPase IMAP family member 8-like isoform X2 n=1 Tax=Pungitius pungitius TaxID=134920 RepID=UPI002E1424AB
MEMNNTFKIIKTPDLFEKEHPNPDQLIIDFLAHCHPSPDLFILAIDTENSEEEKVVDQIKQLQEFFGENSTEHLVILFEDIKRLPSHDHLKKKFKTRLATANENLSVECKKWCSDRPRFVYDYKNYSEDVVKRRKAALEKISQNGDPLDQHGRKGNSVSEAGDDIFNIVLLGLSGTGKSASANTILTALGTKNESKHLFKSEANSMMTTTRCEVKYVKNSSRGRVRLVDTPDFLDDTLEDAQAQVDECKKYCQREQCVVLLVVQAGRFTESERDILPKLEDVLGWKIREKTIVLLTHGEELEESLDDYVRAQAGLLNLVEQCGGRYHRFNNKSKKNKQVRKLIKKIPNYEHSSQF